MHTKKYSHTIIIIIRKIGFQREKGRKQSGEDVHAVEM